MKQIGLPQQTVHDRLTERDRCRNSVNYGLRACQYGYRFAQIQLP